MPNEPGAVLIAEIGSNTTRVSLVDVVAGEFRLVSQGEALSSVEPPQSNALDAVIEAVLRLRRVRARFRRDLAGRSQRFAAVNPHRLLLQLLRL